MFEAVANFASAPRGELFMYASRSATRCSSGGEFETDGVCPCNEETHAMVPTSNRSRVITRVRYLHANFVPARKMALRSPSSLFNAVANATGGHGRTLIC